LGFLFLLACAADSGVEKDTAATMNPTSTQTQYPAFGAGTATNPQNDATTTNSNMDAIQQQNMQQQMMQRMQQNMMNSPGKGMGGGNFGGGGMPMGGGIPR
jgi:hypothetical protein